MEMFPPLPRNIGSETICQLLNKISPNTEDYKSGIFWEGYVYGEEIDSFYNDYVDGNFIDCLWK